MLFLSIPTVQTKLGKYATKRLNDDFGTNINIGKVGLQFNGDVELKEIYVEDYKKDTLFNIEELNTSIISFKNLYENKFAFGDIDLEGLTFNLKTYKGQKDTNLDVFVARFDEENPRKEKSNFLLSSSDVSITNSTFKLSDENRETTQVLKFDDLNINATNFLIKGSDVSMRVNKLAFRDSRGLSMKNMKTNFSYTLQDMTFANLDIETENSQLKGDLKFSYDREDLQFFTDKVNLDANFTESNIALDELNTFYNEFGVNQRAQMSVKLSGTLNDLQADNLVLNTSRRTQIRGDINFKNLFNSKEGNFVMAGKFRNLSSNYRDLKALLPNVLGKSIPSAFDKLGDFSMNGTSRITANDIDADLEINTGLGYVISDLSMKKLDDIDNASYTGNIILDNFDIGEFLNDKTLNRVSMNVDVDGKGFTIANLNTKLEGDVYSVDYNGYSYDGLVVSGNLQNKIFNGKLKSNDKNFKLDFNGLADMSTTVHNYDFTADVEYANLKALNFIKKDSLSIFKGKVDMKMKGRTINDAYGRINFKNTSYKNQNDNYFFKDFAVTSRFEDDVRFIEVNSPDIVQGKMSGKFLFEDVGKLFENSVGSLYTNYVPNEVTTDQYIDFNFKIYNKIVEVFYPDIELGSNTFIRGRVESDEKDFKLTFKSPQIKLLDYFADDIELKIDNKNPLFNTYVEVDSINTKFYDVSKFSLINVTLNDTLFIRSEFKGGKRNDDFYDLSLFYTINEENKSVLGFKKSDVVFKDNRWQINENKDRFNKITFDRDFKEFDIDKFVMNHQNEEIRLSGIVRDSTYKDLKMSFKDVDLTKITPDIDSLRLEGNINGKLDLLQKNGSYLPNSSVVIDDFTVNGTRFGSFDANITGNQSLTSYNVNAKIKDDRTESFSAIGEIDVSSKSSKIDVDLNFDEFNLEPLNAFADGVITNIRGLVNGSAKVTGNLNKPSIDGNLILNRSGLSIPYLNVDYSFDDNSAVSLKGQDFNFNRVKMKDLKYDSKGTLNGFMRHDNFSDWQLGLSLATDRLLVLDTEDGEDVLYYGTGFVGGVANIFGPMDELTIEVDGETKRGTVFKIPLNDAETFGDNSFIHFLTPEEKEARLTGEVITTTEIKGVELAFDLDITQDAEVEIVIDKSSGSSIRGRGEGNLLVEINTNGKFNMYGDISVFEGVYNFIYGGLVQKEFQVEPGGTLAWNGEPLNAEVNIKAIYKTQANPSVLLDTPINRSIPVDVEISLTGVLEKPEPEFDIKFPNVNSAIKSELEYRLDDNESREFQALSVVTTGAFMSDLKLDQAAIYGTLSERASSLINSIFSDSDSKLQVGLDYKLGENNPEYQTDDRLGVTLSTKLSDRVLINGKVGVPIGGVSETVIAGDVQIDFLLNEEGTLTAKMFNRENSIRNFGEEIGYTQGLGIAYNVDFNNFKELLQKIFKGKKEEVELVEEVINSDEDSKLPTFMSFKKKSSGNKL